MPSRRSPLSSPIWEVGTGVSQARSASPVSSCCCTASAVTPRVSSIRSTQALRTGSAARSQAGLRSSSMRWSASYSTIEYGPFEIVACRNSGLSGRCRRYSSGAAEANGSAMMLRKSLVGWIRVISSVRSSGAVTPEMSFFAR